jgi:hypothetical protein
MVLFALKTFGTGGGESVEVRATRYLLQSQQSDGQWRVNSHSIHSEKVDDEYLKRTNDVYSYWGSGWAIISLLHMLPET